MKVNCKKLWCMFHYSKKVNIRNLLWKGIAHTHTHIYIYYFDKEKYNINLVMKKEKKKKEIVDLNLTLTKKLIIKKYLQLI